tara:strand:- start:332 stop:448 length:117 start_codon:yes stop_codon:yes gene_type:complete
MDDEQSFSFLWVTYPLAKMFWYSRFAVLLKTIDGLNWK